MSFVHPSWLLLLLILPMILLGAILTTRANNKAWQQLVAARLRKQLVKEGSTTRRWVALIMGLLGCALLIIVLARPYGDQTSTTEQISSRNLLIAIDTSRSMLVEDVAPNRISHAKAMALELVQTFPNDRIGVIAFSGAAVSMAPLTIDHTAVHETISQLDTNVIPSGGSDLAAAVELAIETFKKSDKQSNALIIISDGEDHSEKIQFAGSEIRDAGTAVCTIGVGSAEGGMIPDLRNLDGKFRDIKGNTVYSKLNSSALEQLANAGAGSYVAASSGADHTIRRALASLERTQESGRVIDIPNETYQWFLCPAIVLLILSVLIRSNLFTRKLPTLTTASALLTLILTGSPHLQAASTMERAADAYQMHDYHGAIELFSEALAKAQAESDTRYQHIIEFSQGSAAYRLSRWDVASRYFSRALLSDDDKLQEKAHYNLGNTLVQWGWTTLDLPPSSDTENVFLESMRQLYADPASQQTQAPAAQATQAAQAPKLTAADVAKIKTNWQDAISHYQASLMVNADNTEAQDNLREVEKMLEQLKQAQEQAKQEAEQKKEDQNKKDQGDQGDQKNKQDGEGDGDKKDSDQEGEKDDKNKSDGDDSDQQDNQADNQNNPQSGNPEDSGEEQAAEPNPEETKEEFAARILREQSDAEVRPVRRRLMQLRRPEKDW
jgi:Ca-activated chloride channel family protein